MAELFQATKQNVSLHIRNILDEGELDEEATVKENLTVQTEAKRQISRFIQLYSLPMTLAVGFWVRSLRGIQFRRWAAQFLSEYLVKGFVLDDARLKDPQADYFEELLARRGEDPAWIKAAVQTRALDFCQSGWGKGSAHLRPAT